MKRRYHRIVSLAATAMIIAAPAVGQGLRVAAADNAGFYGGISLRDAGTQGSGLAFGQLTPSEWSRFATPAADDSGSRAMLYGGYRWRNDFAVEAAVGANERYALRRTDALGRSGVGLSLPGFETDPQARSWNVDVYGSWAMWRRLSLYGRFGYLQSESAASYAGLTVSPVDARRTRDGMNVGVGMRYDMSPTLGLKLEYARFAHFPGELLGSSVAESDQVQFGLQYRF